MACFSEIADAFSREQQEDESFFRLMHAVLRAVRSGIDLEWALRYFELWTLRLHGVIPDLQRCSSCEADLEEQGARYLRRQGSVVCRSCGGEKRPGDLILPKEAIRTAGEIRARPPEYFVGRRSGGELVPLGILAREIFFDLTDRRFRSYEVLAAIRGSQ